jgi:hypothetical protein
MEEMQASAKEMSAGGNPESRRHYEVFGTDMFDE